MPIPFSKALAFVNPARAGMILTSISGMRSLLGKPRASGDDPNKE